MDLQRGMWICGRLDVGMWRFGDVCVDVEMWMWSCGYGDEGVELLMRRCEGMDEETCMEMLEMVARQMEMLSRSDGNVCDTSAGTASESISN